MPVIRDPDFLDYGEYDVNESSINPYTRSKNNPGEPAQLLIDYDDRKFILTAPKYGEIGAGNTVLAGYGGTGGVTGQALYSKFKQIWKEDTTAIKFPFPMEAITPESFEFINGWEPDGGSDDDSVGATELDWSSQGYGTGPAITRKLIKDCGWAERSSVADGNAVKKKYFGIITLGAISRPFDDLNENRVDAKIYCSQFTPGVSTSFDTSLISNNRIIVEGPSAGAANDVTVPDFWTGTGVVYQQPDAVSQGIGLTHNNIYFIRFETQNFIAGVRPGGDNIVGYSTNRYRLTLHDTKEDAIAGINDRPLTVGAASSFGVLRTQSLAPNFFFNITEEGGAANEAFQFYETGGAPNYEVFYNYDNYFKIYCREKGRTYAEQAISQVGVTQINYQAYRIPLATQADANLQVNNIEVSDASVSDENNEAYSGIGVSFFQEPQRILINNEPFFFNAIIDANFKSLPSVYQKVQYLLRNPTGINSNTHLSSPTAGYGYTSINSLSGRGGPSDVVSDPVGSGTSYGNDLRYGATEEPLLEFVGTNLFAKLREDIYDETNGNANYGIYIKDVQNDDLNSIFYYDNNGDLKEEPFVSSFNLVFNTNLNEDNDARFWVFFNENERIAGLSTDVPIDQVGEHNVTDGINAADDTFEFGSPREHHPFVNGQQVVAIGTVTNPGIGISCETLASSTVLFNVDRAGTSYYSFLITPSDYAGKNISSEAQNPELYVYGGDTAQFELDLLGGGGANHPFYIKEGNANIEGSFIGGADGSNLGLRVINNGAEAGVVTFKPDASKANDGETEGVDASYYYICGNHPAMRGNIVILNKLQDSAFVYYVNAIKESVGIGQSYIDITETGQYPNVLGVGIAHSMRLHSTYLDAVANGGVGINTIDLQVSTTNTGVVTFTQVDVNYQENNATIVRTSNKQAVVDGGPLAFLDGIDVPANGSFGLTFDYDFNAQRNRDDKTNANCKVVAIGLEKGQFVSQDFIITRQKGQTVQVAGALERVYNDPTT